MLKSGSIFLPLLCAMLLYTTQLFASSGGYTGRTANTSSGCGPSGCHGGSGSVTLSFTGPTTVQPGQTVSYTFVVAHGTFPNAGCNIAVKTTQNGSANAGTLTASNSELYVSGGELTHSSPKQINQGQAVFSFSWTAPSTPGTYWLQAVGNARQGQATGAWNWATPLQITVQAAQGTLALTAPTASQSFCAGAVVPISWTSQNVTNVKIDLSSDNGATFPTTIIASTPAGTGTYSWTIPSNTPAGTQYKVRISDASNSSLNSVSSAFTVQSLPTISTQPINATACLGQALTLSLAATTSQGTLQYQWVKNGVDIPGANSSSLFISAVAANDAGQYTCRVSNACGSITSSPANLTVDIAPQIFTQPQSVSVPVGSTATFSVIAAGSGLQYQWRKNGTNITGARTSMFVLSVTAGDVGAYDCVITNQCGTTTSQTAQLTIATANEGVLQLSPTSVDLGLVEIGTFKDFVVTAKNVGTADARILLITPRPLPASTMSIITPIITSGSAYLLKPNDSVNVTVRYTPTNSGKFDGRLEFEGQFRNNLASIPVKGQGGAKLFLGVSDANFGTMRIGAQPISKKLTLKNSGQFPISLDTLYSSQPSQFRVIQFPKTAVAPGDSIQATVEFNAQARGQQTALLIAKYASSTATIQELKGVGQLYKVELGVQVLDFATVAVNSSKTLSTALTNTGDIEAVLTGLPMSGSDASAFVVSSPVAQTFPLKISAGQKVDVLIQFTPTRSGAHSATLAPTFSEPNSLALALNGSGESVTSVQELEQTHFAVYPNPTKDEIRIRVTEAFGLEGCFVEVYSIQGERVGSVTSSTSQTEFVIPANSFSSGAYIVYVQSRSTGEVLRRRVVIMQ